MSDGLDPPPASVVLRRALLPALILGLYFALFDAVGTLAGALFAGYSREPWELVRRLVADVLSGVLLVPAGLGEQWLRRRPRDLRRDLAAAAAIVLATAPLIAVTAVGATYASERRGPELDVRLLHDGAALFRPVLLETSVGLVALALPAGVNAVARARGLGLRRQLLRSAASGVAMVGVYALLIPGLLPRVFGGDAVPLLYGAMLLVAGVAPLLLAGADRAERWLDQRALGNPSNT